MKNWWFTFVADKLSKMDYMIMSGALVIITGLGVTKRCKLKNARIACWEILSVMAKPGQASNKDGRLS